MSNSKERILLAVEGGATRTHWRVYRVCKNNPTLVKEGKLGCGNWKILSPSGIRVLLASLPNDCDEVGIFLAGCATQEDQAALQALCEQMWPKARISVGSDRDSGYASAFQAKDGILLIAGTGSAVTGKKNGHVETAAGWGKLLGDPGSGFALSVEALRAELRQFDLERTISPFLQSVLEKVGVTSVRDLTVWAEKADKSDLADLVSVVFAHQTDPDIQPVIAGGASLLADCCVAVARRLKEDRPSVQLMGGIFTHFPEYVELFQKALLHHLPGAKVEVNREEGVEGAAWLALQAQDTRAKDPHKKAPLSSTEEKNPRSEGWETLPTPKLVQLFVDEESYVQEALQGAIEPLAKAVDAIANKLSTGGRLFYIGAGTSGRLGVLDASELPPTFSVPPDMAQGILAGGFDALVRSSEAKEDEEETGASVLQERNLTSQDVVCGLTASGTTPFVWGAIHEAKRIGAVSILMTCSSQPLPPDPDITIRLVTGPELLTGSTRLKAGTATKVALNILSTGAMVRLGRVRGNVMAYLNPSNIKLRQRAARILSETLHISEAEAIKKLEIAEWDLSVALQNG